MRIVLDLCIGLVSTEHSKTSWLVSWFECLGSLLALAVLGHLIMEEGPRVPTWLLWVAWGDTAVLGLFLCGWNRTVTLYKFSVLLGSLFFFFFLLIFDEKANLLEAFLVCICWHFWIAGFFSYEFGM